MGVAPTPVLVSAQGVGNSADGAITRDTIDDLIGAMSSKLLIYLRAKKINVTKTAIVDALGNNVTALATATKNNADTNFNGKPSITFANAGTNQYIMGAGGIGIGAPPVAMTNSLAFIAGIRAGSATSNSLYGDNAGTNGSANTSGFYLDSTGALQGFIGGTALSFVGSQPLLAPGTTGVIWMSYDAATNVVRAGVNSATVQLISTSANTRNGAGTATICYPFGFQTSGAPGNQGFNRWALFNKAFMNGSVPADDTAFSNLVASYAAFI